MIKLIKKGSPDVKDIIDDFTDEPFHMGMPHVEITIECGYGSNQDMDTYKFHCRDEFKDKLLEFIHSNLLDGTIEDRKTYGIDL